MGGAASFEFAVTFLWDRLLDLGFVGGGARRRVVPLAVVVRGDQEDRVGVWELCNHQVHWDGEKCVVRSHDVYRLAEAGTD